MKARIFTSIMLMATLATFAQTSRRYNTESKPTQNTTTTKQNERSSNTTQPNTTSTSTNHRNYQTTPATNSNSQNRETTSTQRNQNSERNRTVVVQHQPTPQNAHVSHPVRRPVVVSYNHHHAEPVSVRRAIYPYRAPVRAQIVWTVSMNRAYRNYYPDIHYWKYPVGYRIASVSAYDANRFVGEVAHVYGKVIDTYYNHEADEYYLYFGDYYPYQDFSIVVSGYEARKFSRQPKYFFENEHIAVTGYVNRFENKPEIQVRSSNQLEVY